MRVIRPAWRAKGVRVCQKEASEDRASAHPCRWSPPLDHPRALTASLQSLAPLEPVLRSSFAGKAHSGDAAVRVLAAQSLGALHSSDAMPALQKLAAEWLPRMNPLGLFAHFLFGCMAGYVVAKTSRGSTAETSPAAGASRWNRFDLFSGLLVVAMLTDLQISNLSDLWPGCPDIVERIFQSRHLPVMSYDWPTFPLLVVALLISLSQSRCLGRWLDNPFFSWTAILSFGIYLWHVPVVKVLWRLLPSVENEPVVQLLFVVASSGFSYLLAHLSYRYCEKPVLDRVHRRAA
jgi:peptidoglycan/LPS O-acetylase OafA/YrhL